ncbi:MAG: radical SAM protein [Clostridia bacterium]|nr:radical SAM protein [Clostridia bacterium]
MYSRVYIEITNVCNMNCSFCHGHSRDKRFMSEDAFNLILDRLSGQTEYIYYHLMGEPLLHPLLPVFLKTAKNKGYKSMITTNGTLLNKCGDDIINAGIHKVNISVHSFEESDNDEYLNYLGKIADFAEKANYAGVIIVLRFWNNGIDEAKNNFAIDYFRSRFDGDWAENSKGLRIRNKMFIEYGDRFGWPDKNAEIQGDEVFCYGLRDHFGILCDGTIVPCCLDSDGVINLGNVFDSDIESILSSERAAAMKSAFDCRKASEELCRRCAYAQRFSKTK